MTAAAQRLDDGAELLAVASGLRDDGLTAPRAAAVTEAAVARLRARERWDRSERLIFTRGGLEQASDPVVSRWRARRFADVDLVADLACGLGGDTIALAATAAEVVAVDLDESRLALLRHNAAVFDQAPHVVCGNATHPPIAAPPFVHADPSRRTSQGRARHLSDYEPAVSSLAPQFDRAQGGAVVVSPGVALQDPDLPEGELEFVQVGRNLVEAVVWTGTLAAGTTTSATVLSDDGHAAHLVDNGADPLPVSEVGEWLVEPSPAAVRARLHDQLGEGLGGWRLARNRALLTCEQVPPESPWWRAGRVEAVLPLRPKVLRSWLSQRREAPIEFVVHGLELDLVDWWRAAGKPQRDWGGWVAHLIRLDDGAVCIVTSVPIGPSVPDGSGQPGTEHGS